jgi:hypothetical protein
MYYSGISIWPIGLTISSDCIFYFSFCELSTVSDGHGTKREQPQLRTLSGAFRISGGKDAGACHVSYMDWRSSDFAICVAECDDDIDFGMPGLSSVVSKCSLSCKKCFRESTKATSPKQVPNGSMTVSNFVQEGTYCNLRKHPRTSPPLSCLSALPDAPEHL